MDTAPLLAAFDDAVERLTGAASRSLDRAVPSCPEWTVGDLVGHCAQMCRMWRTYLVAGTRSRTELDDAPPVDDRVLDRFHEEAAEIRRAIAGTPDDRDCWTWWGRHTAGEAKRRVAHELTVHAWDAEQAVGEPTPIPAELALDGIDEFVEVFGTLASKVHGAGWPGAPLAIALEPTDADEAVTIVLEPGERPRLGPATDPAEHVRVCGAAGELLLLLWGRVDPGDLAVDGAVEPLVATRSWMRV